MPSSKPFALLRRVDDTRVLCQKEVETSVKYHHVLFIDFGCPRESHNWACERLFYGGISMIDVLRSAIEAPGIIRRSISSSMVHAYRPVDIGIMVRRSWRKNSQYQRRERRLAKRM